MHTVDVFNTDFLAEEHIAHTLHARIRCWSESMCPHQLMHGAD